MRKPPLFPLLFAIGLFAASTLPLSAATDLDQTFALANKDFEAGDFSGAASKYLELAAAGNISSDLFYNLGTAKYRLGEVGEAVLWMRRALVVEPAMPEVLQNLEFLRARLAFLEFTDGRISRIIRTLPAGFGKWTVSLFLWAGAIALALAIFVQRLKPNRSALVTLAIVAFMGAFVASRVGSYRSTRIAIENFATVTQADTLALTAPAPDAKSVIALPPGSEVRILRDTGQWRYAEIPGNLRGWIRTESLEPVWPIPTPETNP